MAMEHLEPLPINQSTTTRQLLSLTTSTSLPEVILQAVMFSMSTERRLYEMDILQPSMALRG